MSDQRILLLTLRIKRDSKVIADAVEWNFGYCPQEDWFDKLLAKTGLDNIELSKLKIKKYITINNSTDGE